MHSFCRNLVLGLFIINELIFETESVYGGGCLVDENNIYYTGGTSGKRDVDNTPNTLTFKLDFNDVISLSQSSGPWSTTNIIRTVDQTGRYGSVADLGNSQIAYIGGTLVDYDNSLTIMDLKNNKITSQSLNQQGPYKKVNGSNYMYFLTGTSKKDGSTFLHYGGVILVNGGNQFNYNVRTFDTKTLEWNVLPGNGPALYNFVSGYYNNKLFFAGGFYQPKMARALSNITIYDTNSNTWSTKTATGDIPSIRVSTSYIQKDNLLYVVGGTLVDLSPLPEENTVFVLDLNNLIWTSHQVFGFSSQTAFGCLVFYRDILISGFGGTEVGSGATYMIYTKNWTSIDYKSFAQKGISVTNLIGKDTLSTGEIVGIVVSCVAVIAAIIFLTWFFRRRQSKSETNSLHPPELLQAHIWATNDINQHQHQEPIYSLAETQVPNFDTDITRVRILGHNTDLSK